MQKIRIKSCKNLKFSSFTHKYEHFAHVKGSIIIILKVITLPAVMLPQADLFLVVHGLQVPEERPGMESN